MIRLDPDQVLAAREGKRAALQAILRTTERPVYNLAIRMLEHPADAEDATQEILIKIVIHLAHWRRLKPRVLGRCGSPAAISCGNSNATASRPCG